MKEVEEKRKLPTWFKYKVAWGAALHRLPSKKLIGVFSDALYLYVSSERMPDFGNKFYLWMLWETVQPEIDRQRQNWENGCKGGEYGKLGGRPPKKDDKVESDVPPSEPIPFRPPLPKPTNIIEVLPEVSEQEATELVSSAVQNTTHIPADEYREMIKHAFFEEKVKNPFIEVQKFLDFNQSKGWLDSKNKLIKDKVAWFKNWDCKTEKRNLKENNVIDDFWQKIYYSTKSFGIDDEYYFIKFYPYCIHKFGDNSKAFVYLRNEKEFKEFENLTNNEKFFNFLCDLINTDEVCWDIMNSQNQ